MEDRSTGLGKLADALLRSDDDVRNALDGYDLFFDVFIRSNPAKYISFPNFVYKHFADAERLKTQVVFARKDGRPVAMQWYLPMTVCYQGKEYRAAHSADTCALPEGRGITFLKMFGDAERAQKNDGVALRFGSPNENSMKFIRKFGAEVLGGTQSMYLGKRNAESMALLKSRAEGVPAEVCVALHERQPFDGADYDAINAANSAVIWAKRTPALFAKMLDGFPFGQALYVTARDQKGRLLGYVAARQASAIRAIVYDWDVLDPAGSEREALLSRLFLPLAERFDRLSVGMVNPTTPDAALLASCGFNVVTDGEGNPSLSNFSWTPYQDGLPAEFSDYTLWKTRNITEDWVLNAYQPL